MRATIKTLAIVAGFVIPALSQAASLSFSGQLDIVNDPDNLISTHLGVDLEAGDDFTVSYSATVDTINGSVPGPVGGTSYFVSGPHSISLDFDNGLVSADGSVTGGEYIVNPGDNVTMALSIFPDAPDRDRWYIFSTSKLFIDEANQIHSLDILVTLIDTTQTRLTNEAFFLEDSFVGWEIGYVDILLDGGASFLATGSANLAAVPVPAAAWLFGSGLLALLSLHRRKKCAGQK